MHNYLLGLGSVGLECARLLGTLDGWMDGWVPPKGGTRCEYRYFYNNVSKAGTDCVPCASISLLMASAALRCNEYLLGLAMRRIDHVRRVFSGEKKNAREGSNLWAKKSALVYCTELHFGPHLLGGKQPGALPDSVGMIHEMPRVELRDRLFRWSTSKNYSKIMLCEGYDHITELLKV